MTRNISFMLFALFVALLAACSKPESSGNASAPAGAVIATQQAGALTVTLSNSKGHLSEGESDFTLAFRDAKNQPVDVGAITVNMEMPAMGSMPQMKSDAKLVTTETPGIYQGHVKLDMAGSWQIHVKYKGPAGEGKADFPINAK